LYERLNMIDHVAVTKDESGFVLLITILENGKPYKYGVSISPEDNIWDIVQHLMHVAKMVDSDRIERLKKQIHDGNMDVVKGLSGLGR
jgi:hypothetical protein